MPFNEENNCVSGDFWAQINLACRESAFLADSEDFLAISTFSELKSSDHVSMALSSKLREVKASPFSCFA